MRVYNKSMKRRGRFRTKLQRAGKPLYAIRNADGTFANIESISRSMKVERRRHAKTLVKPGRGFRGDTKPKAPAKRSRKPKRRI